MVQFVRLPTGVYITIIYYSIEIIILKFEYNLLGFSKISYENWSYLIFMKNVGVSEWLIASISVSSECSNPALLVGDYS